MQQIHCREQKGKVVPVFDTNIWLCWFHSFCSQPTGDCDMSSIIFLLGSHFNFD